MCRCIRTPIPVTSEDDDQVRANINAAVDARREEERRARRKAREAHVTLRYMARQNPATFKAWVLYDAISAEDRAAIDAEVANMPPS